MYVCMYVCVNLEPKRFNPYGGLYGR